MKSKTIVDSWDKIEPGDAADDRMLNAILEKNRSMRTSIEKTEGTKTSGMRKKIWIEWGAVATAFVILLTGALTLPGILKTDAPVIDPGYETEENNKIMLENTEKVESDTKGIYIPGIDLAAAAESKEETIMLVVYKGGVYTYAGSYYGEAAQKIDSIVGERLGYATGSINEWSTQDEYAKEFASTYTGDVYAVNGYDTSFRVCFRNMAADENDESILCIHFMDRLKDITISEGKDLFEDRLHLKGRVDTIQWLTHDDWNNGNKIFRNVSFDQSVWDAFLDATDNGEFVNTFLPEGSFYEDHPYCSIYETPNQAHMYLTMKDGTTVELRLIEGGYVGYQALGWYFVKIPGEAFEAVYNACGGTHLTDW